MRFQPSPETSERSNCALEKISSAACASSMCSSRAIGQPVVGPSGCCPSDELYSSYTSSLRGFSRSLNLFFLLLHTGLWQLRPWVHRNNSFCGFHGIYSEPVHLDGKSCQFKVSYWLPWLMAQVAIFTPHIWGESDFSSFVLCWFCFPCLGKFHLRLTAAPEKVDRI